MAETMDTTLMRPTAAAVAAAAAADPMQLVAAAAAASVPPMTMTDVDIHSKGDGSDRDALTGSVNGGAASAKLAASSKQKCVFTANLVSRPTSFNPTATPFVSQQLRTSTPNNKELVHHHSPQQHGGAVPSAVHYAHHGPHGYVNGYANGAPQSASPNIQPPMAPPPQQQLHRMPSAVCVAPSCVVGPAAASAAAAAAAAAATGPKGVDGRIWRSISARHVTPMYAYENELNRIHSSHSQYSIPFSTAQRHRNALGSHHPTHRDCIVDASAHAFGPVALPNGTIQIRLRDGIRVDMTLDKAVRVINCKSRIAIALASNASSAALFHPNGKVYQFGTRVEIVAYDGMQTNNYVRYAKMWYKGVSFTSENCALIYLVDTAGTRTTTDSFTDMTKDYTITVFLNDSRYGPMYAEEAMATLQNANYWCNDDGTEVFDINGFRITQTADGLVKVTRSNNKCLIRTSPGNGSATLTTAFMHCTASLGQTSHLFVRRGERRMHFDGSSFVVRNAGHSAGFDDNNLLKVY